MTATTENPTAEHPAEPTVLGMLAYGELAAFSRLAADAAVAPDLGHRIELSRLAGLTLRRLDDVSARVAELGSDLEEVMRPFAGVLVAFDQRTEPSTWWERLLKTYVGYSVADDFSRIVATAVGPRTAALAGEAAEGPQAPLVVDALAAAAASDAALASRLALWGRRLVGEALGVVQNLLVAHPALRDLLEPAVAAGTGDVQQRLFSVLTAEHSRRMERLGLTP